jgi:pimeloyl-ACP methyl ester carboxylesterase
MKIKRSIVFLLCLVLAAIVALPVTAKAPAKACACGEVVQVFVDGFGQPLYYNEGTPEQAQVELANMDQLEAKLPDLFAGAGKTLWNLSWDPLADSIIDIVYAIMGHLQMDGDGNSVAPITSNWHINPQQNHTKQPHYYFGYDFRIDPFTAATQLNSFIEALCLHTGHGKVALQGHSEGAVVVMTYLKMYGTKRLDSFLLVNGAWQGLSLVGELFQKKVTLSGPAVVAYLNNFDEIDSRLKAALNLLESSSAVNGTMSFLGRATLNTVGLRIFEQLLMPLFVTMPAVWSFVPAEDYAKARELIAHDPQYAKLLATADRYHNEVQTQAARLLKGAQADGVKVAVLCSYGYNPIPIGPADYQCDTAIDTAREAGGATTALLGQRLPLEAGEQKYRSPDGIFDASTCILPDSTWFIAGNKHNFWTSNDLRMWIIHSKAQPTVWQNPKFPQYLRRTESGGTEPFTTGSQ